MNLYSVLTTVYVLRSTSSWLILSLPF